MSTFPELALNLLRTAEAQERVTANVIIAPLKTVSVTSLRNVLGFMLVHEYPTAVYDSIAALALIAIRRLAAGQDISDLVLNPNILLTSRTPPHTDMALLLSILVLIQKRRERQGTQDPDLHSPPESNLLAFHRMVVDPGYGDVLALKEITAAALVTMTESVSPLLEIVQKEVFDAEKTVADDHLKNYWLSWLETRSHIQSFETCATRRTWSVAKLDEAAGLLDGGDRYASQKIMELITSRECAFGECFIMNSLNGATDWWDIAERLSDISEEIETVIELSLTTQKDEDVPMAGADDSSDSSGPLLVLPPIAGP